jgi:hypothetical protein
VRQIVAPTAPTTARTNFLTLAKSLDATNPLQAAYLICASCYLSDAALAFFHHAAAHAEPGVFRRNVPPGLKSAEATRAWLGSHLDTVREMARSERAIPKYKRDRDLVVATQLAAEELDHALAAAKMANLELGDRHEALFKDATDDLIAVRDFVPHQKQVSTQKPESLHSFGLSVLGGAR